MNMVLRRGIITLLALVAMFHTGRAQQSRETFGKNRIQYRQFDWQYLSGENFDIYYYDGRKDIAREALEFLEGEFDRMTDLIGYPPYFKTKVFLYNSLVDLRQSNVGLNHTQYSIGGETEFIKPYVEVAHLGTIQEFKEELLTKTADLMVNEMMFGGNLKDIFQSALLLNLPDWFVDGASLYVAKGWSSEMDDFIREFIKKRRSHKIGKLDGREAALAGQSVWNFIAEKYGKSSVSNILNYTRVTRNEEKSILITLGIPFKVLMTEWEKYYTDMHNMVEKSYISPADSLQFTGRHNKTTQFTTVKISPDGQYIAYAENDRGRTIVRVRSLATGREKTILTTGSKVINQRVDYRIPLLSWADANTLGVIGIKRGEYVFWLYDLNTRTKLPRELDRFSNVRSFDFSSNGRLAILSADFEGQNDLFLVSSRRDRVRRLTNDVFDDLDPSFIPNTSRIVFSSNRETDSLKATTTKNVAELTDNYNLFIFDLDSTKEVVARITNTLSKDYSPLALDDNTFFYLSDQRGITNVFKYDRNTSIYSQVTNFATNVKEYDLNFSDYKLAYVLTKDLQQNIYVQSNFSLNRQVFTPATRRKELQQARVIHERRKQEENKNMSIKDLVNSRKKEVQEQNDSIPKPDQNIKTDSMQTEQPPAAKKDDAVNTDNYTFEDEVVKPTQQSETFLTRFVKAHEKSRIKGPFPYESKFSAETLVTSLVISPLWGLGIMLETQMNDMLEDYRFYGGIQTALDLRSSDIYAEFQYLPGHFDLSVRFDRKSLRWDTDPAGISDIAYTYQYSLHKLEFGLAAPINDRLRLTINPFGAIARSVSLGRIDAFVPPSEAPVNNYYAGVKSEIVYDNSISTGLNVIEGTRGKIFFQHYQGLNDENNSFSKLAIDLRHYQRIYKEISFAVRGYAGSFFGRSPKQFLLGGIDNWAFYKTRYGGSTGTGEPNPLGVNGNNQDMLFIDYASSLRGFNYGTLFGNNVLFLNAEFRVPLVRALTNGPISSNFFRNLQFLAFYDIGTSWSGKPPFTSEGTSVSYEVISTGPGQNFEAEIKNYLNPWLYSYGVGVRTVVLGYFVKLNLAWPVEDYVVGKPRFSFGLGLDF